MDVLKYNLDIQMLLQKISENQRIHPKEVISDCCTLIDFAKYPEDASLLGFAYFHLGESYFSFHDYSLFVHHLIKGISYLEKAHETALLARSYNLLAISEDSQGNFSTAIDHYLLALRYCKEEQLDYETGLIYMNIANLYLSLREYPTAIYYYKLGLDFFRHHEDKPFYMSNLSLSLISIADSYYNLSNLAKAWEYVNRWEKECEFSTLQNFARISYYCLYVKLLTASKDYQRRDAIIKKTVPLILSDDSLLDIYYEIFDFCQHLFETKKYEEFFQILNHLESQIDLSGIEHLKLKAITLKINYYRLVEDKKNCQEQTTLYFDISQKMNADSNQMTLSMISLRFALEDIRSTNHIIEQKNRLLKERSETDSLTGLPNRYRLNEYSEEAFERALSEQTFLAVEIFDIDCFKQYNDTYGHQAGDDVLRNISTFLKDKLTEGVFCARYGGDEFIMIYEQKTDEEILAIANQLKDYVASLQIEHKNSDAGSYVTITQGIRNSIPTPGNKMWDFLFAADAALYHTKRKGKNAISLVHKTVSQSDTTSTIQYTNL